MKPRFAVIVFLFFTISSVLSGMKSFNDTREMVDADLHQALVLTLAAQDHTVHLPLLPCHVINTTGGGDAMMAGLVWAHLQGLELEEAGRAGLAASAIAVESGETVSPQMSEAALLKRMRALRCGSC